MSRPRLSDLRAVLVLLLAGFSSFAPLSARGQFATLLDTTSRYAGNSTGTAGWNEDLGAATATSLNVPSYVVMDSHGNLYISDKQNNCVRKVDTSGAITTVAGLRVSGSPDTCNPASDLTPDPTQGLFAPTGLAIDSNNTLYIADSQHNCVRSLAYGVVDSYAANALTTVAGTCTYSSSGSNTPSPDGLAVDGNFNLYISIADSLAGVPVYQVVRHAAADSATTICYVAGSPSIYYPGTTMCSGVSGTVELDRPAGLAFDKNGNLFIADSYNDCIREIVGLTTQSTVVGQCSNDGTGSATTALSNPYGLGFSADGALYISELGTNYNKVVGYNFGSGALTPIAGLLSGASGAYNVSQEGQSALLVPLNQPLGVTTDAGGNLYLADSQNNVVRRMGNNVHFPDTLVGQSSAQQTLVFSINQNVNLTSLIGSDFVIMGNTCTGSLSSGTTCQVIIKFHPSRPGYRYSYLKLTDSISGATITTSLEGLGIGPLSLLTPGQASTRGSALRTPVAVTTDAAGDAYVLEQGNGSTTADVLFYPAAGGAGQVVVNQGTGLVNPSAIAVDGAGNIYVANAATGVGASTNIARFGVDGTTNLSYATGLLYVTSMTIDGFGDLYVAMGGSAHNVTEIYAGGQQRVVMGTGANTPANGGIASAASLYAPTAVAYGPSGLIIADAGKHYVYQIDSAGIIAIVAGNGTTTTTTAGQATGTGLNTPYGLAVDAAGDIYISDSAVNRVYEVYSGTSNVSNIATVFGTGTAAYTGDGGYSTLATLNAPAALALDGSSNLFVIDGGNSALREVTYPVTNTLGFGNVADGSTSAPIYQYLINAGNSGLTFTPWPGASPVFTPVNASNVVVPQYAVYSTTCSATVGVGDICDTGYTFTPTVAGALSAQSNLVSNSYNTQQTIYFTAYGYAGGQALPFSLANPETEIYGSSFLQSLTLTLTSPFIDPTGSMAFAVGALTTCTISGPFATGAVNCPAPNSHLDVGAYTVDYAYTTGDSNYISTTGTTTLNVTPAPLTVTCNSYSRAYGAANPTLDYTITGLVNGDTVDGTIINVSCTTTATTLNSIGGYTITPTVSGTHIGDYTLTANNGTLTIAQPATQLVITVNPVSRPYGSADPSFSSTITGAVNGDTFTVSYTHLDTLTTPAGTYVNEIQATVTGANLSNYSYTVIYGTLTITQAPLNVTCPSTSRQYGTANPAFPVSSETGQMNGDTVTATCSTSATISFPVGTYPITPAISGALASNYSLVPTNGTLTITQAPAATITINNNSRAYGAADPAFSYSNTFGVLNGDTFVLSYSTLPLTTSTPVGVYASSINGTITGGSSTGNYVSVTVIPGTLTITPATTQLVITVNPVTRLYGAADPSFTSTITGAVNGDTFTVNYTHLDALTTPVGTYANEIQATVTGANLSNYSYTINYGTLTITQAPLSVTCTSTSRQYGAANPAFGDTITGLQGSDTVTVNCTATATSASPVSGSPYTITPTVSGASLTNYSLSPTNGTLTITQAPAATITITNNSRAYGVADPTFSYTNTSGVLNGDVFALSYSTLPLTTSTPVGIYASSIKGTITGGSSTGNYVSVTVVPGTLTITLPTTQLVITVNPVTRAYGLADPAFSSTITGAVNGDVFTVTYSPLDTLTTPIGTYTNEIQATVTGANLSSYSYKVNFGTLTITAASTPLVVTCNNKTRAYGAANPVFDYTVSGLLGSDTVTVNCTTTATSTSSVAGSPYTITPTVSGASLSNYTLTHNDGTLTINPAPAATITINSTTRAYGVANPTTYSYTNTSGVLNGDTFTLVYSTSATIASPIGPYPISAIPTGAAAANYSSINVVPGTLTITQALTPLVFTVASTTRSYGVANPTFTSTVSGALNGDTFSVNYTTSPLATTASPVGSYQIIASGATGTNIGNYATVQYVPGTLTITPEATATVVTTSATPVIQGTNITFTATVTSALGAVPTATVSFCTTATTPCTSASSNYLGSGALNASGVATFTTSALTAGTYTITATYQTSTNYTTSSSAVAQVVTPGSFTVSATPLSQFIRGAGTTVYEITVSSVQGFEGPVTLSCAGLPADATCSFGAASSTVTLAVGGTATTTMTITNTAADARLQAPTLGLPAHDTPGGFSPMAFAATFPFGLGALLAGLARRRRGKRSGEARANHAPKIRLLIAILCTAGIVGMVGCACHTSIYQMYTIPVTGTTTVSGVSAQTTGTSPNSASPTLVVAEQ